jgi:hypothetical protein
MTILPGHPIAVPDAPPPAPPKRPRGPRTSVGGRTLAVALAGVVAAGGGGAWFMLRPSGHSTPAAAVVTHQVVHHPKAPVVPGRLAAPRTKAEAMVAATRIFSVLPAQLPGWHVDGKPTFDTGGNESDPFSRSFNKCLGGATRSGTGVDSPSVSHRTSAPTYQEFDVTLNFVRSAAVAASDLAVLARSSTQKCVAHVLVGQSLPAGSGATVRITSMRPQPVPGRAIAWQIDGRFDSANTGPLPVRIVMLATVDRATEFLVASVGFGAALPLASDEKIVTAVIAQTRHVIA